MWTENWRELLKSNLKNDDFSFGHNMGFETKEVIKTFSAVEALGINIEIDYEEFGLEIRTYSVRFFLPKKPRRFTPDLPEALLVIITELSPFSNAERKTLKRGECLEIEWHF